LEPEIEFEIIEPGDVRVDAFPLEFVGKVLVMEAQ
jgi:hypothetical protein